MDALAAWYRLRELRRELAALAETAMNPAQIRRRHELANELDHLLESGAVLHTAPERHHTQEGHR